MLGPEHLGTSNTYAHIGVVYERLEKYNEALEMHKKDLEITKWALDHEHMDVVTIQEHIADICKVSQEISQGSSQA